MGLYILSLDSGGAGIRALLFDKQGNIRIREYIKTPASFPCSGAVEHDPLELWEALLSVCKKAIKTAGGPENINALGISNQRASFCLWEKDTGKPLSPVIGWADVRAADVVDRMNRKSSWKALKRTAFVLGRITGSVMLTATSMLKFTTDHASCRLKWLLERDPALKERCLRGEVAFGTLDSWFVYNLTGKKLHLTDSSNAAATSLFNPFDLKWNDILCKIFDIPMSIFPEVRDTSGNYGFTDSGLFGREIPICSVVGDQMAALFGHCCFEAGDVKISQGSGAFVDMNVGPKGKLSRRGLFPLIAWTISGKPTYMLEGYVATAGTLIDWLGQGIGLSDTPAALNDFASQCEDTEGVVFVPTPSGIRFPYFNPRSRASIMGLSLSTHRRHVARAVFEGIAFRLIDILLGIEKDTGVKIKTIKVDGGVSRSDILLKIFSDLSNRPISRAPEADMSATGAAYLAGLSCGFWKDFEELKGLAQGYVEFSPSLDSEVRNRKIKRWNKAVKAVLSLD